MSYKATAIMVSKGYTGIMPLHMQKQQLAKHECIVMLLQQLNLEDYSVNVCGFCNYNCGAHSLR